MAAAVGSKRAPFVEISAGAEPFARANRAQANAKGVASTEPKAHTLSLPLSAPPPDVVVGWPRTATPELAATATMSQPPGASTSVGQRRSSLAETVVRLPDPSPLDYCFDVRQQWEGVVTNVDHEEFSVVLRDILRGSEPEYEAVLSIEEVSEDDLPLLKEGAVLYWTIGYKTRTGTRERVSTIRLRHAWSRSDIERVGSRRTNSMTCSNSE